MKKLLPVFFIEFFFAAGNDINKNNKSRTIAVGQEIFLIMVVSLNFEKKFSTFRLKVERPSYLGK